MTKKNINNECNPSGIIFPTIEAIICNLKYLNLIEIIKLLLGLCCKKLPEEKRISSSRIAVDLFILIKWVFLFLVWIFQKENVWFVGITWYLLLTNLYTYFYHHCWANEIIVDQYIDLARIKRRFTNIMLAVLYSLVGFAYLYAVPYRNEFAWVNEKGNFLNAIWFSISNSLTASYDQVKPISDLGNSISMIQLVIMFVFLTIIISSSIPYLGNLKKE